MSAKRKRVVLTIKQKLNIIQETDAGSSAKYLAKKFNIGSSTVRDIYNNREKIVSFVMNASSTNGLSERKAMKTATYEELDKAMIEWYSQKMAEGAEVTGPECAKQAHFFFEALGMTGDFSASWGWLKRFKIRHGIGDAATPVDEELMNCVRRVNSEKAAASSGDESTVKRRKRHKRQKSNQEKHDESNESLNEPEFRDCSDLTQNVNFVNVKQEDVLGGKNTTAPTDEQAFIRILNVTSQSLRSSNAATNCVEASSSAGASSNNINDDYNFLMSFLPYMKKMSMKKKLFLRVKMQELLYNTVCNNDNDE